MTTSNLLKLTGEALYGPQWQSQLARDLNCNVRTVQRWAAGSHEPPPSIWQAVREVVQERQEALAGLLNPLSAASSP